MKNSIIGYLILLVACILFNALSFLLPINRVGNFWVDYGFTMFAFVFQIVIWNLAFDKKKNMRGIFYGISLAHIGIVYLVIQIIAYSILLCFLKYSYRIHWAVNIVILCIMLVYILLAMLGRNEINRLDNKQGGRV